MVVGRRTRRSISRVPFSAALGSAVSTIGGLQTTAKECEKVPSIWDDLWVYGGLGERGRESESGDD